MNFLLFFSVLIVSRCFVKKSSSLLAHFLVYDLYRFDQSATLIQSLKVKELDKYQTRHNLPTLVESMVK